MGVNVCVCVCVCVAETRSISDFKLGITELRSIPAVLHPPFPSWRGAPLPRSCKETTANVKCKDSLPLSMGEAVAWQPLRWLCSKYFISLAYVTRHNDKY